jgi:hypothetical protein
LVLFDGGKLLEHEMRIDGERHEAPARLQLLADGLTHSGKLVLGGRMHQQIRRGDEVKSPQNVHGLRIAYYVLDAKGVRLFFALRIRDHHVGTIHAHDARGALAFQRTGEVAIPACHI